MKFLKSQVLKESMGGDIKIPRIELNPLYAPFFCQHFSLLHEGRAYSPSMRPRSHGDLVYVQYTRGKRKRIFRTFDQLTEQITNLLFSFLSNENSYCRVGQHFFKEGNGKRLILWHFEDFGMVFGVQNLHIPGQGREPKSI
ncbi:MAG: hypothetical protein M3Y68_16925 [Chloroflexota bacterium]|nr:hypothetical protein [Chloroflexota bacterium]